MKPTRETYIRLEEAYDFFNEKLFDNKLPPCVLTLQRQRGAYGNTWSETKSKHLTDEIALNSDTFASRSLKDTLSTLVHEQCHLKQHHFGKPSRNGYHNKEWASMMFEVGLIPSDTGYPGGKTTGQNMTHYIDERGRFSVACDQVLKEGFTIPWHALTAVDTSIAKNKAASKTKYSCSECGLNAWAKPGVILVCGSCENVLEVN